MKHLDNQQTQIKKDKDYYMVKDVNESFKIKFLHYEQSDVENSFTLSPCVSYASAVILSL